MKLNKIILRNLVMISIITLSFVACDEDFSSIDSDIINNEVATSFNTTSEKFEVISYTDALNPVQTSGLGINKLGVYNDPNYGRTTANVLTQVSSSLVDPSFGDNVVLDSVVLTIPFFSTTEGIGNEGETLYALDSVFPRSENFGSIKLSMFESTFFLRDFDPSGDFDEGQRYFSNRSASTTELISTSQLEAIPISVIAELEISEREVVLKDGPNTDDEITERLSPRIRQSWSASVLDHTDVINYWTDKIINQEGLPTLSNNNNFTDYFRGIYFKAEPFVNDVGVSEESLMLIDLASTNANITLHYSFDSSTEDDGRDQSTYVLNFSTTRVNFLDNDFSITDGDEINGDESLNLKGGQGSIANIKLFNGENSDDDDLTDNTFEAWRKQFVNLDDEGEFESFKRLINEANLTVYVDQSQVNGEEPDRLYLYDKTNGAPLIDYFEDSQNATLPQFSVINHLGVLERDEDTDKGIKYKMRITSHINNLLANNTENVELGLAVSGNINLEASIPQFREQTSNNQDRRTIPVSSIISPRGTVLHGNNSLDTDKKLMLEIFYTCLETDANCPN